MAQGCVYALVALGFVLIYKATETVNFAQGDLMMLGGFFALTASVSSDRWSEAMYCTPPRSIEARTGRQESP